MPPAKDLAAHFMTKGDSHDPIDISSLPTDQYVELLDEPITLAEVHKSSLLLKERSTSDGWCPKMINSIHVSLFPVIVLLFNSILSFAFFPTKWCRSLVAALFKNKGSPEISKYYRPVTLVELLYKWLDFIFLGRFKAWFKPADEQTAYQDGKSCADHNFLLRALICYTKKFRKKFFICTLDFDGAFDRVSRNILLKKLAIFGAGSLFLMCLASMYKRTESIIIQKDNFCSYELLSGIKQGLPLSPFLFIFYINDVFAFFYSLYDNMTEDLLKKLHILIHADDANILATTRDDLIKKIHSMMEYCKKNMIRLQVTKCMFLVINGNDKDKEEIPLDSSNMPYTNSVIILGTPLSDCGDLRKDLDLHLQMRFKNCIKYFNFIRTNRIAPIAVKLKALTSCVMSTLLYNCETFGPELPKDLEKLYLKLIKSALNVRPNVPDKIALIESGLLPLRALVWKRQLNFFRRFKKSLGEDSMRQTVFEKLLSDDNHTEFVKHYISLDNKYTNANEIYLEALSDMKSFIREKACEDTHYKYFIYSKLNPELLPSPFLVSSIGDPIIRFRCGSHSLPIETGRWSRTPRDQRLCSTCKVVGDEHHLLFECANFTRDFQTVDLSEVWKEKTILNFFKTISKSEFLRL